MPALMKFLHLAAAIAWLGGVAFMIVGIQFVSIGLLGEMLNNRLSDRRDAPVARTVGAGEAVPVKAVRP